MIKGNLGVNGKGEKCSTDGSLFLCVGEAKCAEDVRYNGSVLAKGLVNPVACLQKKRCDDVSVVECFKDQFTQPLYSDRIDPVKVSPRQSDETEILEGTTAK